MVENCGDDRSALEGGGFELRGALEGDGGWFVPSSCVLVSLPPTGPKPLLGAWSGATVTSRGGLVPACLGGVPLTSKARSDRRDCLLVQNQEPEHHLTTTPERESTSLERSNSNLENLDLGLFKTREKKSDGVRHSQRGHPIKKTKCFFETRGVASTNCIYIASFQAS